VRIEPVDRAPTARAERENTSMRTIGNILWLILNGFWMAIAWALIGVLLSITIVLLPFGRQCFKLANFALWPFGRTVVPSPTAVAGGLIGNILWFIPGLFLAIGYAVSGVALCLTIIGIPFGIQSLKFVPLALFPFGKEIARIDDLRRSPGVAAVAP
jgi:uncharacterized membrane protein YccF (DUF307 family)